MTGDAVQVPFNDLRIATQSVRGELDAAIAEVLDSGRFLLGSQGEAFEREFAAWCGVQHAVGVASGTEAIRLALLALGVSDEDEVVTVANAGVPPVAAILAAGATPRFVDVDPTTATIDPAAIPAAMTNRTRAILAVHLYGHPADMDPILEIGRERGVAVLEDCAQAHGTLYRGAPVGTLGDAAAFSFYPTKNLGALGDAGLVTTMNVKVAERVRLLRNYGWRTQYVSELPAINSRLDELQAAVLRVKLRHLPAWNLARRERAAWYAALLGDTPLRLPTERPWGHHVFHLYVAHLGGRDALRQALAERGIGTAIHYPLPAHLQEPFRRYGGGHGSLPVTERLAAETISLPMFPDLRREQCEQVATAIHESILAP